MPLIAQRILRGLTPFIDPYMTPAKRSRPEKIILGVKPGHRPSDKPPVRIFLGSERKQFRAERAFLWSVEKHRDPGRIYEIYLLKGLKGYISGFWITGFTNYRFAIPYFCDFAGRAIYNDVDQVWLTDPAELFDRPMKGAGFLSINDHDTSVMLIDCQRMAGVWNRESVLKNTRKRIEARAREAGLWGDMPGGYNARDKEYLPGESACVHFTTLHTQPWRPFPEWFVYDRNPTGELWFDLEREADAARFLPVSSKRPTSSWPDVTLRLTSRPDGPELAALLGPNDEGMERVERRRIEGLLERIPDGDLPWVLDRLFRSAHELEIIVQEPIWIRGDRARRPAHFWIEQFALASRLNPDTRYRLERRVGPRRRVIRGGPRPSGPIVLMSTGNHRPTRKAEALGNALSRETGRNLRRIAAPGRFASLLARVFGAGSIKRDFERAAVVIAAGSGPCRFARALAERCSFPPGMVLMGHRAGSVPEHDGVVLSMEHHALPPHPHRIEMLVGFGHAETLRPTVKVEPWRDWLAAPRRAGLLVGEHPDGAWPAAELEELAERALDWADRRDSRLLVVAPDQSGRAGAALSRLLGNRAEVYCGPAAADDCPYGLALERSGALLLAGSEAGLLQDALMSRKPLFFWPLRNAAHLGDGWAARIAERAFRPSYNKRGSIRPQQGLTYLCARWIERGWVLPPTGPEHWQKAIVDRGLAAWIDDDATPAARFAPETPAIVERIVETLRLNEAAERETRNRATGR
jgi:hypothetical protein